MTKNHDKTIQLGGGLVSRGLGGTSLVDGGWRGADSADLRRKAGAALLASLLAESVNLKGDWNDF